MVLNPEMRATLRALNDPDDIREVIALMRAKQATLFIPGDRVTFEGRAGRRETGVVTKINAKSVNVKTDAGVNWRVAPSLLTEV